MAIKVDKTTQIILTQKITHFFNSLDAYTVVEQHKEYNKTKSLGYGASTLANIQHGHGVSRKTIIRVMEGLGLSYDKQYFLTHGIIKHVENEQ